MGKVETGTGIPVSLFVRLWFHRNEIFRLVNNVYPAELFFV